MAAHRGTKIKQLHDAHQLDNGGLCSIRHAGYATFRLVISAAAVSSRRPRNDYRCYKVGMILNATSTTTLSAASRYRSRPRTHARFSTSVLRSLKSYFSGGKPTGVRHDFFMIGHAPISLASRAASMAYHHRRQLDLRATAVAP